MTHPTTPAATPAMDAAWVTWAEQTAEQLRANDAAQVVAEMPELAITDDAVVESLDLLADKLAAWERVGPNRWRMTPGDGGTPRVPPAEVREAAADALENVLATAWVILDAAGFAKRKRITREVTP